MSETLLGEFHATVQGYEISAKILASAGDESGELSSSTLQESVRESCGKLEVEQVEDRSLVFSWSLLIDS